MLVARCTERRAMTIRTVKTEALVAATVLILRTHIEKMMRSFLVINNSHCPVLKSSIHENGYDSSPGLSL